MCQGCNRRQFLESAALGGMMAAGSSLLVAGEAEKSASPATPPSAIPGPVTIHKVYVGFAGTAWPKPEIDIPAEVAKFEALLTEAQKKLGNVRLVGGEIVQTPAQAAVVVAQLKQADGVLLVHLSLGTGHLMQQVVEAGRPTVIFSQPFSGHEWMFVPAWQKAGKKVVLLATSDYGELARGLALLRVPGLMQRTRMILVGHAAGTAAAQSAEQVRKRLGVEVVRIGVDRIVQVHKTIDARAARAEADRWIREAKKVVEPTPAEILKSART